MIVKPASELCLVQVTGNLLVCHSLEAHLQEIHLLFVDVELLVLVGTFFIFIFFPLGAQATGEISYLFFCPCLSTAGSRSFTSLLDV